MLSELQAVFTNALLQDDDTVVGAIQGDGLAPEARTAIYRHHVFTTLTEVLKAAYPIVCRLVDERFFAYAAAQYIRQQPPTGPCLFEYGASLPRFLADFPPCQDLVYLPDVARLEWAINAAWHAEDATALDLHCLRSLASNDLASLTLSLEPSVSYVSSPWPIDRIWRANQLEADPSERVSLDAGAAHLEIRRLDDDVTFRSLETGTFAFRSTCAAGLPLEQAFEAAFVADPHFDLATALHTLFTAGLVVDMEVSLEGKESQ
jgi:hypothetical protein